MTLAPTREDTEEFLDRHEEKDLLRFITCGSVDDGKSTLVGRMLYEAQQVLDDQLADLQKDSRRFGTQGAELDLALLVDGLAAEREQGITIDVAYRFFSTDRRNFVVADTPGHVQYTRNMVTGASNAELAVILVDARHGVTEQTRRHTFVVSLLGVTRVVLAVNKMDLVGYDAAVAHEIEAEYRAFTADLGFEEVVCVPVSALAGDNVVRQSPNTPWYEGPALLDYLESVPTQQDSPDEPFRMPVQLVLRPDPTFRGLAGTVSRGTVRPGDEVTVLPAGSRTTIEEVLATDAELRPEPLAAAVPGEAVCVRLADEVDASRGDVLVSTDRPAQVADQFEVDLVWMSEQKLIPGRSHLVKIGTRLVPATVSRIKYGLDVSTLQRLPREQLGLNDVAVAVVAFDRPVPFDPYRENRSQGGFVMIDRVTGDTVGVGMIRFALRRSDNLRPHPSRVTREDRANAAGHRPGVVWFTGYSGAGKSTIADLVEQRLHASGMRTTTLDGDNLRRGLNRDLGFSEVDRVENVRRVGEVAALMADAGLIVLVALISPFRADRERARQAAGEGEFVEVFVDTPLETARGRDVKGLYAKAARGSLPNLPGVDAPYEPPLSPDVHLDTSKLSLEEAADTVVEYLTKQ